MKRKAALVGVAIVFLAIASVVYFRGAAPPLSGQRAIASIVPLTGAGAEFGPYNLEAAQLFVEDYNRAHPGSAIQHVFQDSKSTAKDGINALQAILLNSTPFAVQAQLSAVSAAVASIASEKKMFLLTIAGTAEPKKRNQFSIRNYPDPVSTAQQTAEAFVKANPEARIAVLRINDEFGMAVGAAFRAQVERMKLPLVADETFDKSSTDFRASVTKVVSNKPTLVYIVGFGNPLGRIIVQLRELGFKGDIVGGPEVAFNDVLQTASNAAEGVRFLDLAFDAEGGTEPARSFIRRYREKYGRAPTAVSAVAYDGWSLVMLASDRAGSTDAKKIAAELLRLGPFDGVCGQLVINPERDVVYPLAAKIIENGKVKPLGPSRAAVK
jgi:branched-chain amino acid transport system substrate-binding protein